MELLLLLKEITADGKISDHEIRALQEWASHVHESNIPPVRKLAAVIQHVCEDGKLTHDEREFVFKTIESVLPPEDRAIAKFRRQQAKKDEKLFAQEVRRREAEEARAEAERNEPLDEFETYVAGTRYENRHAYISTRLTPSTPVFLIRERGNRYSANAVAVVDDKGVCLGYVPEDDASDVADFLDRNHPYKARIKKIWTARDGNLVPIIQFEFYRPDCAVPGLVKADFKPFVAPPPPSLPPSASEQMSGLPLGAVIIGICVLVVILAIILANALS